MHSNNGPPAATHAHRTKRHTSISSMQDSRALGCKPRAPAPQASPLSLPVRPGCTKYGDARAARTRGRMRARGGRCLHAHANAHPSPASYVREPRVRRGSCVTVFSMLLGVRKPRTRPRETRRRDLYSRGGAASSRPQLNGCATTACDGSLTLSQRRRADKAQGGHQRLADGEGEGDRVLLGPAEEPCDGH